MAKRHIVRSTIKQMEFKVEGTFQSMYAAQEWVKENGYDYGSSCTGMPTAIMKGDYYSYDLPHKWRNFTSKQRNAVHGTMIGDLREGPVFVKIFE